MFAWILGLQVHQLITSAFWSDFQDIKMEKWVLTNEGETYTATGSPEMQLFLAIPPEGIPREELQVTS